MKTLSYPRRNCLFAWAGALLLLALPVAVQAQFTYTTTNDTVTVTGYNGPGGAVTIPATINDLPVTSIADSAFYESGLTSVTIPDSVTSIGDSAFEFCSSLKAIQVDAQNLFYSSVNCVLFDENQTKLVAYPWGRPTSYTIPYGVTSIGDSAFYARTRLTTVTIPYSVTNIGDSAFEYCTSLTAITVDAQNELYSSVNGVLFDKKQTTLVAYPGRAAAQPFRPPLRGPSPRRSGFGHAGGRGRRSATTLPKSGSWGWTG